MEIFLISITCFIPSDTKLIVVEWVSKRGTTVTDKIAFVMPQIDYDRPRRHG
jgi:hypothetical protein